MESDRKVENFADSKDTKSDENKLSNGVKSIHKNDKENANPNKDNVEGNIRRHDEPSELSFEIC